MPWFETWLPISHFVILIIFKHEYKLIIRQVKEMPYQWNNKIVIYVSMMKFKN